MKLSKTTLIYYEALSIYILIMGMFALQKASDNLLDPIGWFGIDLILFGIVYYIVWRKEDGS